MQYAPRDQIEMKTGRRWICSMEENIRQSLAGKILLQCIRRVCRKAFSKPKEPLSRNTSAVAGEETSGKHWSITNPMRHTWLSFASQPKQIRPLMQRCVRESSRTWTAARAVHTKIIPENRYRPSRSLETTQLGNGPSGLFRLPVTSAPTSSLRLACTASRRVRTAIISQARPPD
ncbi:hypothetical protein PHLGIDRAFT_465030 [Phlebiopsis gigantea 11061_1 CR5-6]|uniref:Uncharacterized protein n=1 Tax=Phlebiopsis gigantea (strain 11061_1 CR5-6) TaxID=745531 RepID=A0A0C3RX35_PHLG1|nr:hypothetical protein PHLGIDRAFT_465030 [Phlebiopsis gigantea 11061_1 CR5-6]